MAKKPTAAPIAEKPAVQFVFVTQTDATSAIGWPTSITGVVGLAVAPREIQLQFAGITGGRVLVDIVDTDAVLAEAKANNLNTPMAKSRTDLKTLWAQAQQDHGKRVSEHMAALAASRAKPATDDSQASTESDNSAPAATGGAE